MECKYLDCHNPVTFRIIQVTTGKNKGKKRKISAEWCTEHTKIVRDYEKTMIEEPKPGRKCKYPGCPTTLAALNRNQFCFRHNKVVSFGMEGQDINRLRDDLLDTPKVKNKSQWEATEEVLV